MEELFKRYIHDQGPFDIIGDIHGCKRELILLLEKLGYEKGKQGYFHKGNRKVISVGDLNDRGTDNIEAIEIIMNMVKEKNAYYVFGNHCNKFYRYLLGRKVQKTHGLDSTVKEFESLSNKEDFRKRYLSFYETSSPYLILDEGKLIIAHAGIKESLIGKQNHEVEKFCIYGDITGEKDEKGHPVRKNWFFNYKGNPLIVYGHTPVWETMFIHNTIDIDTGCVFGGKLTALRYPEREIVQVNSQMEKQEEQLERMRNKTKEKMEFLKKGDFNDNPLPTV